MSHDEFEEKLRELQLRELLEMNSEEAINAVKKLIRWYYARGYDRGVDDNNKAWGREGGIRIELEELPHCEECGKYPADWPSLICVGCAAYHEHQR